MKPWLTRRQIWYSDNMRHSSKNWKESQKGIIFHTFVWINMSLQKRWNRKPRVYFQLLQYSYDNRKTHTYVLRSNFLFFDHKIIVGSKKCLYEHRRMLAGDIFLSWLTKWGIQKKLKDILYSLDKDSEN